MSEAPNTDKNSGLQFDMKPNFGFIRSPPGILMILNMVSTIIIKNLHILKNFLTDK